ncbi:FecR family protein [Plebeiibacterium sediminum]|uniref:FecR domain-containing protein n=1 Tax=Plebeiibacterium sediminum TaxID=2992112 RepID=A0AAE3SG98_9BACT|nr:FecR family protein [Plebeiobacterium sediminum]MCW3788280.1 FecR domain-containing protein [Plebeiobacterium sediminum]
MAETFFKNIISRFTKKKYSEETEMKFRYWLSQNKENEEVEKAMFELWNETPNQITDQTLEDLAILKSEIANEATPKKSVRFLHNPILKYAAVFLLLLTTSIITYISTQPKEIAFTEYTVPKGETKNITLADGTVVSINAGSSLIYPKEFVANTRSVFLTGEAIFRVAKNPDKPFIVNTNHISVRALGTAFNVQAYAEFDNTTTTLIEGKVRIKDNYSPEHYDLDPNQQLIFDNSNHKIELKKIDAEKATMWEKGYLIFENVAFSEIISTVERKYNVQINYDEAQYIEYACNVKFKPDESISDVMSVLCELTTHAEYEVNNNQIIIHSVE